MGAESEMGPWMWRVARRYVLEGGLEPPCLADGGISFRINLVSNARATTEGDMACSKVG